MFPKMFTLKLTEFAVIMGTFNTDHKAWQGMIGKHGDPAFNENGWYLLQLCCIERCSAL